ncbi:conserved hypothetical protein [Talaromyces stipitatus ATCC 10500]|uniref:Protein kinase domain-containing protein n=1 Tax=Talaromyces stipitatus (strain ATCC 10500 / CBS 375.48 / QM 6759 / NRRL 1006) TaxID=441959 RepID=B8MDS7_TALSN|nr:uncharacterized protein TSTA_120540 [Talaromyces stipitatus ATCC 10500]EED18306.1 conserved hypothetical protein [Talaromyces stipitatus ATCC 10500]
MEIFMLAIFSFSLLSWIASVPRRYVNIFEVPVSRIDEGPLGPEAPTHVVIPLNLTIPSNQVKNCTAKITDFGSSFFLGKEPSTLHTPAVLCPPEIVFRGKVNSSADIWTLGCTLYDMLGERPLFETWADDPDEVIGGDGEHLGKLSTRVWQQWEKRPEFFLEGGIWNPNFSCIQPSVFRPLSQRLWQMGRGETLQTCELDEMEMDSLRSLLRAMLAYEPSRRITADGAINSDWILN